MGLRLSEIRFKQLLFGIGYSTRNEENSTQGLDTAKAKEPELYVKKTNLK